MSVIEKVPFLHEIMIADAQELAQVISPGPLKASSKQIVKVL